MDQDASPIQLIPLQEMKRCRVCRVKRHLEIVYPVDGIDPALLRPDLRNFRSGGKNQRLLLTLSWTDSRLNEGIAKSNHGGEIRKHLWLGVSGWHGRRCAGW